MTIEERLQRIRQDVDEVLRALVETTGTPPPQAPSPRSADVPMGCKHQWSLAGFGTEKGQVCVICGAKK